MVVVATDSHVYDKVVSNIQETRARGAHVIAIATDGNEDIQHHADDVIYVPRTPAFLQAVLAVVAAAAAGVPDRAPARPERRPAAQPGQDGHRRVAAGERGQVAAFLGVSLLVIADPGPGHGADDPERARRWTPRRTVHCVRGRERAARAWALAASGAGWLPCSSPRSRPSRRCGSPGAAYLVPARPAAPWQCRPLSSARHRSRLTRRGVSRPARRIARGC